MNSFLQIVYAVKSAVVRVRRRNVVWPVIVEESVMRKELQSSVDNVRYICEGVAAAMFIFDGAARDQAALGGGCAALRHPLNASEVTLMVVVLD